MRPLVITAACIGTLLLSNACSQPIRSTDYDQTILGANLSVRERQIELPLCVLRERTVSSAGGTMGPIFFMLNGVPVTSLIYENLAVRLADQLNASARMVDLPGTGGSVLSTGTDNYSWTRQRACLENFLESQKPFYLILHDLAGPVLLPALPRLDNLQGVVVLNTVLQASTLSPPFPLNWLRHSGPLAKPMAYSMPFFFYEWRLRKIGFARNEQVDSEWLRALFDDMRQENGMGRLVQLMQGLELTVASDRAIQSGLATEIPMLFIWGQQDPVLGKELSRLSLQRPNQQIKMLANAKHFLMVDFADEIGETIALWMKNRSATAVETKWSTDDTFGS